MQASAHKLAEAMYKAAGGASGAEAGGPPPPEGEHGEHKESDVIDAEFEDKS